jgi:glycosyltransferase involved in cell wall biosynthesis
VSVKTPLITVIVAAYNQEKYIGRCMRSLLAQNFPREDFNILVVEDGSSDRTHFALELFSGDIEILKNDQNLGLPASLNLAIRRVQTPYFVRVDSDDFVSRNFLLFLFSFINYNPHMDAVACDYNLVDDDEKVIERKNCLEDPIACGILFRTAQVLDIGCYDEKFRLHEERDLRFRFLQKYAIHRLEMPIYRYRRHDNNITNNKEAMDFHMSALKLKHGTENL